MTSIEITLTTCDKCGHEAPPDGIVLTINGKAYEIDLCEPHRSTFDVRLSVWTAIGRPIKIAPAARRAGTRRRRDADQLQPA